MAHYRIAVIPGDGVGNEISAEATKILYAVAEKYGFGIETVKFDWGCDYYLKHGRMMADDMLDILKGFDAIFLGCVGDTSKVPDHISLTLLLTIRKGFDQYVNLRPIQLYPGIKTLIKTASPKTVDMVVVRENTEGEYAGLGGFYKVGSSDGRVSRLPDESWRLSRKLFKRICKVSHDRVFYLRDRCTCNIGDFRVIMHYVSDIRNITPHGDKSEVHHAPQQTGFTNYSLKFRTRE